MDIIWEKVRQARERKIKQLHTKRVEDAAGIHITEVRDIVRIVVLEEVPNGESLLGEIDIMPLMVIKDFASRFS